MIKMGRQSIEERAHLKEKNDCTVRALMDSLERNTISDCLRYVNRSRKKEISRSSC